MIPIPIYHPINEQALEYLDRNNTSFIPLNPLNDNNNNANIIHLHFSPDISNNIHACDTPCTTNNQDHPPLRKSIGYLNL